MHKPSKIFKILAPFLSNNMVTYGNKINTYYTWTTLKYGVNLGKTNLDIVPLGGYTLCTVKRQRTA